MALSLRQSCRRILYSTRLYKHEAIELCESRLLYYQLSKFYNSRTSLRLFFLRLHLQFIYVPHGVHTKSSTHGSITRSVITSSSSSQYLRHLTFSRLPSPCRLLLQHLLPPLSNLPRPHLPHNLPLPILLLPLSLPPHLPPVHPLQQRTAISLF